MKVTIPEALGYSVLGFAIVFLMLIILMGIIVVMGKVLNKKEEPVKAAAPAPAPAPAANVTAQGEVIKSPMPGVILNVKVTQGQAVKSGEILCILEAMKMENEIVAPKDGTVAQIVVAKGANVDTGAPLIVLQ